jgi:hypothetical protein
MFSISVYIVCFFSHHFKFPVSLYMFFFFLKCLLVLNVYFKIIHVLNLCLYVYFFFHISTVLCFCSLLEVSVSLSLILLYYFLSLFIYLFHFRPIYVCYYLSSVNLQFTLSTILYFLFLFICLYVCLSPSLSTVSCFLSPCMSLSVFLSLSL